MTRNMKEELDTATIVMMDSKMQAVAVQVPISPLGHGPLVPTRVMYSAYGIYDATNDRLIKWKFNETFLQHREKFRALEPDGEFLRGKSKMAKALVGIALAMVGEESKPEREHWFNLVLTNKDGSVVVPEFAEVLDDYLFHPDDEEKVQRIKARLRPTEEVAA